MMARRLAQSNHRPKILRRREYRWIRAAVQLLVAGGKVSDRLPDVATVSAALSLVQSDLTRPALNGCLVTSGATIPTVAKAVQQPEDVILAYSDLFFNVIDRRGDLAYIRKLVAGQFNEGLLLGTLPPTDDEELLQVGFRGTIEDVLRHAGWIAGTANDSNEVISDRILRHLLVAADAWTGSGRSLHQPPPAMVTHAIDYLKRSKADAANDAPVQIGSSFGALMREQLELDATTIRGSIAMLAQQQTNSPIRPNAA